MGIKNEEFTKKLKEYLPNVVESNLHRTLIQSSRREEPMYALEIEIEKEKPSEEELLKTISTLIRYLIRNELTKDVHKMMLQYSKSDELLQEIQELCITQPDGRVVPLHGELKIYKRNQRDSDYPCLKICESQTYVTNSRYDSGTKKYYITVFISGDLIMNDCYVIERKNYEVNNESQLVSNF